MRRRDWSVLLVALAGGPFVYAYLRVYCALLSNFLLQWTGISEHVSTMAVVTTISIAGAIMIAATFAVAIALVATNPRPVLVILAIAFPLTFLVGITVSIGSVDKLPTALGTVATLFGVEAVAFTATCFLLAWRLVRRGETLA